MEIKNRSAYHEYFIDAKYEAGMVLLGTEVKSIRNGKVSFNDSYCLLNNGEAWIKSLHIAEYSHGNINNHDPVRERKLLLSRREIRKIEAKLKEKGFDFQYFTNLYKTKDGVVYYYCYEQGYLPIENDFYVLVIKHDFK